MVLPLGPRGLLAGSAERRTTTDRIDNGPKYFFGAAILARQREGRLPEAGQAGHPPEKLGFCARRNGFEARGAWLGCERPIHPSHARACSGSRRAPRWLRNASLFGREHERDLLRFHVTLAGGYARRSLACSKAGMLGSDDVCPGLLVGAEVRAARTVVAGDTFEQLAIRTELRRNACIANSSA